MGVIKCGKYYYFRAYIPKRLYKFFRYKTLTKTLRTKNKIKAHKKSKQVKLDFLNMIRRVELVINKTEDLKKVVDKYMMNKMNDYENEELYPHPNLKETLKWMNGDYFEILESHKHDSIERNFKYVEKESNELLEKEFLTFDDEDFEIVAQYLNEKYVQSHEYIIENISNDYYTLKTSPNEINLYKSKNINIGKEKDSNSKLLQTVFERFIKDKINELGWNKEIVNEHKHLLKSLILFFGENTIISDIKREQLLEYRNLICKLPLKWSEKKEFKNMKSLKDVIKIKHSYKILSTTTVNKYLTKVHTFFHYCDINDYIDKNYATELKLRNNNSIQRTSFSKDDINKIVSSKFFNDKLELHLRKSVERVFIPIIALYSGLRLNEICQLNVCDIRKDENIYYFDINEHGDKKTKNKTSIRKVPIHEKIIESGFIKYINNCKKESREKLWKNLKKQETGLYSKNLSDWFRNFKIKYITDEKEKVFHSFRHNFSNELKQNLVERDIASELLGHSSSGGNKLTYGTYAKDYDIKILNESLQTIDYEVESLNDLIRRINKLIV